jgi:hypothetical protein
MGTCRMNCNLWVSIRYRYFLDMISYCRAFGWGRFFQDTFRRKGFFETVQMVADYVLLATLVWSLIDVIVDYMTHGHVVLSDQSHGLIGAIASSFLFMRMVYLAIKGIKIGRYHDKEDFGPDLVDTETLLCDVKRYRFIREVKNWNGGWENLGRLDKDKFDEFVDSMMLRTNTDTESGLQ